MKTRNYYIGNIKLGEDVIFVFGSNPEGRHGAGAALVAKNKFGAKYGIGEGLVGSSYALPTKDLRVRVNNGLRSISRESIIDSIRRLYQVAEIHSKLSFCIAYRNTEGVSLNGYSGYEMISMFIDAGKIPDNIVFSEEWVMTGMFDII